MTSKCLSEEFKLKRYFLFTEISFTILHRIYIRSSSVKLPLKHHLLIYGGKGP